MLICRAQDVHGAVVVVCRIAIPAIPLAQSINVSERQIDSSIAIINRADHERHSVANLDISPRVGGLADTNFCFNDFSHESKWFELS